MMTCMMFKDLVAIKPYYVVPKKYSIIPQQKQETEGMKDIVALPDYKIEVPSKKLIKCKYKDNHDSGKLSKKKLKDMLNSLI